MRQWVGSSAVCLEPLQSLKWVWLVKLLSGGSGEESTFSSIRELAKSSSLCLEHGGLFLRLLGLTEGPSLLLKIIPSHVVFSSFKPTMHTRPCLCFKPLWFPFAPSSSRQNSLLLGAHVIKLILPENSLFLNVQWWTILITSIKFLHSSI